MKVKFAHICIILAGLAFMSCKPGHSPEKMTRENITVFASDSLYTAWPSIVKTNNGDILVVFSETEEHMAPNGKIMGIRSHDEGKTWSKPFVIYDSPLDDRESGITKLHDGTFFINLWTTKHSQESYQKMPAGSYFPDVVKRWIAYVNQPAYKNADSLAGGHAIYTKDGGQTWSAPVKGPDSIHGGIELSDGTILVVSYHKLKNSVTVNAADKWYGPWNEIAEVESPKSDSIRFGEPSVLQLPSGRVIMMIRATAIPYNDADPRCFLWETYSDDNGKTWVHPYQTPLWGFPPHLLLMKDGRVVVTYGYRRPPYGIRAAVSKDGITWKKKNEVILRKEAPNKDLGYPASVELNDGKILTVYYLSAASDTVRPKEGPLPGRHKPDILGTIWTAPKVQ